MLPSVAVRALFPTFVYEASLAATDARSFNRRLLAECIQYRQDDAAGRDWSRNRYPGGYTSYGSLNRMHTVSPTFAMLERKLRRHVRRYARAEHRPWFTVAAEAGKVVLFESWLRHEVPPNPAASERVSVSFNYSWF